MSTAYHVVVGLGKTGYASAKYLAERNIPFVVTDTRQNPPMLAQMQATLPHIKLYLGGLDHEVMRQAATLVISPGLSLLQPAIKDCISRGIPAIGDIELFVKAVNKPIVAITGTNGKSTVTTLMGEMALKCKKKVRVGGNLGTPVLSLIDADADLYVLELSSFQLETTYSLKAAAATILNVTPDHMDRYRYLSEYVAAKQKIYHEARAIVLNRDDTLTKPPKEHHEFMYSFGLTAPKADNEFGMVTHNKTMYLARGDERLLAVDELKIRGQHNWANALACLALGYAIDLPLEGMLKSLREFPGLAHRCQLVSEHDGIAWYNDSKGTNVGATLPGIEGLGKVTKGKIILLAGGQAKGQHFTDLCDPVANYVKSVILFGEDAKLIEQDLKGSTDITLVNNLAEAVTLAKAQAESGDAVLLSPACASFDMFRDFEHRGEVFADLVKQLELQPS